jgi:hypothetical protein
MLGLSPPAPLWAYLLRKLVGLSESNDRWVTAIGLPLHATFAELLEASTQQRQMKVSRAADQQRLRQL